MANLIRIKRRITGAAGAPSTLAVGELAFNEMDNTLYIGKDNNGSPLVVPVGGSGEFLRLSNVAQTVNGTITFATHPIISAAQLATSDNSTKVATTAWVKSLGYTTSGVTDLSFGTHNTTSLVLLSSTGTDVTFLSATTSLAGLMSSTDKTKLDGIASGATANTGTVTSVALSLPNIFTVSGSPVTTSGTLTATLASQTANHFFAAPNGSAGAPTFRAMVAADVPTLTASKISDFDTQVRTSRLDQMAAPTADVAMNNRKITGLATPTNAGDAANKEYVDAAAQGIHTHTACRVATTGVLPNSPTYANGTSGVGATLTATSNAALVVDGVTVAVNDRILVKDQASALQNGVYVVTATGSGAAAYVLTRATDMNEGTEFPGSFEFVTEGTANADNGYVCTTNGPVTVGTTAIDWTQFSGAGQISAGNGLTKTGNTIDVVGTVNRITVNANDIDIASTYVGQTSITTLGTITTGTWSAGTIAVARGGTGATTLTSNGIVYGNGTSAVGVTAAGTWDSPNSIGQILSHNSSGVPVWTDNIDGGTF